MAQYDFRWVTNLPVLGQDVNVWRAEILLLLPRAVVVVLSSLGAVGQQPKPYVGP